MTEAGKPIRNGVELAQSWPRSHRYRRDCPECGEDASRSALVQLAYTFEECFCGSPTYAHLVETLHHRACLLRPFAPARKGRTPSLACQDDLRCYRNDGHAGEHAYPNRDTA